jgi:sugar transferase (PEP-CTERM/EpsH1 system associated)
VRDERSKVPGHGDPRPLIAHIVFRFDVGGLENGLVNLVNGLPRNEFRHAIIALTEATDFRRRLRRDDVAVYELHKRPGKDVASYLRLYRLLRALRPAVVHTRNFGTLDCTLVAWLAGVRVRIHGEHGWDVHDPDGTKRKYRMIRRAMNPLVRRFVAVSRDLERWLVDRVGIPASKVQRVCNAVDTERFSPARGSARGSLPADRFPAGALIVGSVTRFEPIKDPLNLVRAFIAARQRLRGGPVDLRLLMVGDGPLRPEAQALLDAAGEAGSAWLPGSRADVADLLGAMQIFALGSRREGISNTVLEAMASGLPVIASATGGNVELVVPGETGVLVPPGDSAALTDALVGYATDADLRAAHGRAARARAEQRYSLARMVNDYRDLYRTVWPQSGVAS